MTHRTAHRNAGSAVLGLALVLALAQPSSAQQANTPLLQQQTAAQPTQTAPDALPPDPGTFSVTPFVGIAFGGNLESTPGQFGIAAGYAMTERLTVEGEFFAAPGAEVGVLDSFETDIYSVSANILYHFLDSSENFTPYGAVGLGALIGNTDLAERFDDVEDDSSTALSFNVGGGVKAAMNERWGVRLDARYFNGDDFAPDHWRVYAGVIFRGIGQ
ncbi:MAG: outer membrane protein [Vicinamibacterales bacterium]